jgi:hypothetical protein
VLFYGTVPAQYVKTLGLTSKFWKEKKQAKKKKKKKKKGPGGKGMVPTQLSLDVVVFLLDQAPRKPSRFVKLADILCFWWKFLASHR